VRRRPRERGLLADNRWPVTDDGTRGPGSAALVVNPSFRGARPERSRRDRRESRNPAGRELEIPPLRFAPVGMTTRLGEGEEFLGL